MTDRIVVQLIEYKGAWISREVGTADDSVVYYIRKSSLRDKSEWPALLAGSRVSLTIKHVAGRGIVSDATLVTDVKAHGDKAGGR